MIVESISFYTPPQILERVEEYLLGEEVNLSNQEVLNIGYHRSMTLFNRLKCFDEEGNFIPNESGKILEKFTKLIAKPHGEKAIEFFSGFKYRYRFYEQIDIPASFAQKDLESKVRIDREAPIPYEDMRRFLLDRKYMAYDYIDRYKLIENPRTLLTAFMLMLTILKSEKQLGKDSEKIREMYGKRVESIKEAIEKIGIHLFRFIHRKKLSKLEEFADKRMEIVFLQLKRARELNVVLSNTLEAERFLKLIIDNCGEQSLFLKNLIKVAIELDKDKFILSCNSLSDVKSTIVRYGLDSDYELEYILREFFDKPRLLQYTYGTDFRTITSTKLDITKRVWENLLREKSIRGLLLASRLMVSSNILPEEKEKILAESENLIIDVYCKMFSGETRYEMIFTNPEMKNFEFLRDESFDEKISLIEDASKTYYNELLENLPKAVIFMSEYSLVARNALRLFTILEKDIKFVSRVAGGFNLDGSFMLYKTVVGEEEFYNKMYNMGVGFDSLLRYFAKTYYKNPQEDFKFYNFAHNHRDEVYKTLETIKFESNYDCERVVDLLYGKYHGFDNYAPLVSLAKNNGTSAIKIIEEKLVNREESCREEIERLKIGGGKAFVEMATRLIRIWDNKKIGEDLKNISDIKEVESYLEKYYPKKLEKLAPYIDEIDYSKIRIKDTQEFASESLIKFYITEYMGVSEFFVLNSCKKISSLVEIEDLKELVKKIFEKWQADGMKSKYRNILLPLTLLANTRDFIMLKELVTLWITKPSLIELLLKAIGLREDKNSLAYLDTISKKHKSSKVKNMANTVLSEIAKRKNISLEELGDIIIPDFDFVDRVRYFDYGKRKIKAYLDGNLNISFYDESGKSLKSLPKASKKYEDNEELVEEYKEELKAIKKQLKSVVDIQKSKLFKAILLQRKWRSSTWQELFISNVVMNTFAIGIIWEERDREENLLGRFRYMEDGSFTTVDEDEYDLQEDSYISPANLREMGAEEIARWKEQLEDYEITQPVEQLSLNFVQLSKGDMERKNIPFLNDRVINYYQLKKLSDEFGYYDKSGGYFLIEEFYYKDLESGVVAVIDTEHCINKSNPLEFQPIINIYFKKGKPLPLKEVPLKLFDYVMMTLGKVLKV